MTEKERSLAKFRARVDAKRERDQLQLRDRRHNYRRAVALDRMARRMYDTDRDMPGDISEER